MLVCIYYFPSLLRCHSHSTNRFVFFVELVSVYPICSLLCSLGFLCLQLRTSSHTHTHEHIPTMFKRIINLLHTNVRDWMRMQMHLLKRFILVFRFILICAQHFSSPIYEMAYKTMSEREWAKRMTSGRKFFSFFPIKNEIDWCNLKLKKFHHCGDECKRDMKVCKSSSKFRRVKQKGIASFGNDCSI